MLKIPRAYLLAFLPLCAIACSSAMGGAQTSDSGPSGQGEADGGMADAALSPPEGGTGTNEVYWPKVVLVNGTVNGAPALGDPALRVCIPGYPYPLPDEAPMPESSYAGVARGRGADLGTIQQLNGLTTISVFSARDTKTDGAFTGQPRVPCTDLDCDSGADCLKHVDLTVNFAGGPNLVVIRDDAQAPGGLGATTGVLSPTYEGQENQLSIQVGDYSGWVGLQGTNHVQVLLGLPDAGAVVTPSLDAGVVSPAPPARMALPDAQGYVDQSLSFEALDSSNRVMGSFSQPLASVAFLSDPGTAPSVLFGHRSNYVLVLVGDPQDTTSAQASGGYDPLFDGAGLHAVAVPYSPAVPR